MKNISEYINLPRIRYNINNDRKKYICEEGCNKVKLCENYLESSFEDFIKLNNITLIDEQLYKYYIEENFMDDRGRYYGLYQKHLYESIMNSYSASDLMEKIQKLSPNIKITNIEYNNPNKATQFSFYVENEEDLTNLFTDKVIHLLHQYNYYLKERLVESESKYKITIEPYKPKEITNKIYKDLHGILYHITTKEKYINKIKYKELIPKWKGNKYHDEFRDGRIFFIGNNDEKKIQEQLKSIKNTSEKLYNTDVIVLKIDLNKYKNKLRFRIDSSAFGYNAYFTEEPIPDFCITPIDLDTWKEINKKEL